MSSPNRTPLTAIRPGGGAPLGRGPGLAPLPPQRGGSGRIVLWLVLVLLLTLGLTYVVGHMVEPVRAGLARVPVAGGLFAGKVWPVLWNKAPAADDAAESSSPAKTDPVATPTTTAPVPTAPLAGNAAAQELQKLADEAAARLAAAEVKEKDLKEREAAIKAREDEMAPQQAKLATILAQTEALRTQLEGQLRTEKGRVEVVRAMSRSAQAAFFGALTDDETITILKYMTPEETAKILERMDPYRAARIYQRLPITAP